MRPREWNTPNSPAEPVWVAVSAALGHGQGRAGTATIGVGRWSWNLVPQTVSPLGETYLSAGESPVRNALGFMLQMAVLMFLPLVIGWQLFFGFPLLAMPASTLLAIVLFSVGHALRQRS